MADTQKSDTQTGTGSPVAEQVKQQTQQAVQQGQHYAGRAVDAVRAQVKTQLTHQKDALGVGATEVAQIIKQSGESLQTKGLGAYVSPYIEQAATILTNFGTSTQQKDVDEVIRETEQFARVQPTLFLGGAILLGFATVRFLKSSGTETTTV